MKIKHFENIVKYLPVLIVCLLIGVLGRLHFIAKGADEFTVNVVFIIFIGLGISIYAIFGLIFNELIDRMLKSFVKNVKTNLSDKQTSAQNFEKIREEQQAIISDIHQAKIETAIHYTKQQFALYTSDDDLKLLCENVILYLKNQDFENVKSIKVNSLSSLDIYHFGWNIWNYFKVTKQEKIAHFLKIVFTETLNGVEVESIKRHLKDDERKGIIKITDNLSDFN